MPRSPRPQVSFTSALSHASADKRVDILRGVGASGSISQAARDAGVSYKAAWQAIDTLTNLAGVTLVERVVGGAGGGGARLTSAGQQLLAAAGEMARARHQVLGRLQHARPGGSAPAPFPHLAIRTSMRNQMPCAVASVQGPGPVVRVHLRLVDGTPLVARITRESAQLLALRPGQGVLALCKATAVTVSSATPGAPGASGAPGQNLLQARASRVSRSDEGDEISAVLPAGLALVGFAPAGSGLRARSRVSLAVDEAALVLALPD